MPTAIERKTPVLAAALLTTLALVLGLASGANAAGGVVSFGGFPDGTVITTQTQAEGAVFGSAAALGFPGTPDPHLCPDGPTVQGGNAVAPACPSYAPGYTATGTMARLTSPARSVTVLIGTTVTQPAGFAADVVVYDASGNQEIGNAALVGNTAPVGVSGSTQGAGPAQTVTVNAPGSELITYVALFFDGYGNIGAQLVFNNLAYTTPTPPPPLPPVAQITKANIDHEHHNATFLFTASGATGFQCALVKRHAGRTGTPQFTGCSSPKAYTHLKPGNYTFEVRAQSSGGIGPVVTKRFTM